MRAFIIPAQYRAYMESVIRTAEIQIRQDVDRRADDDPRVQKLATVPDQFITPDAKGSVTILLGAGDRESTKRLLAASIPSTTSSTTTRATA